MSLQYGKKHFEKGAHQPLFVLVDPVRDHLAGHLGLGPNALAGILANCRAALAYARASKIPAAFVGSACSKGAKGGWIKRLEPGRADMIFRRRTRSCYSNPYFWEASCAARELVVAGFPGEGGVFETVRDASIAGHKITFLQDAIAAGPTENAAAISARSIANIFLDRRVQLLTTAAWRASTDDVFKRTAGTTQVSVESPVIAYIKKGVS